MFDTIFPIAILVAFVVGGIIFYVNLIKTSKAQKSSNINGSHSSVGGGGGGIIIPDDEPLDKLEGKPDRPYREHPIMHEENRIKEDLHRDEL